MKRTFEIILTIFSLLGLVCGCGKDEDRAAGTGTLHLTLGIGDGDALTRADAYTTASDVEKRGWCAVFVFNADGDLEDTRTVSETYSYPVTVDLKLTRGGKTVAAVVNMPSSDAASITTLAALHAYRFKMSNDLNVAGGKYFQMVGETAVTVGDSPVSATLSVKRVAARVVLRTLYNSFADMKINRIYLSNVAGDWCSDAPATVSTWYNVQGRSDRTRSHIIDGSTYTAGLPELTYLDSGSYLYINSSKSFTASPLYCYPNPVKTSSGGYTSSFSGEYTNLVVDVTLLSNGATAYYLVPLNQTTATYPIEGNYSYTVDLKIYSKGSDDPNTPVSGQGVSADIYIQDWYSGREYTSTFTETGYENK